MITHEIPADSLLWLQRVERTVRAYVPGTNNTVLIHDHVPFSAVVVIQIGFPSFFTVIALPGVAVPETVGRVLAPFIYTTSLLYGLTTAGVSSTRSMITHEIPGDSSTTSPSVERAESTYIPTENPTLLTHDHVPVVAVVVVQMGSPFFLTTIELPASAIPAIVGYVVLPVIAMTSLLYGLSTVGAAADTSLENTRESRIPVAMRALRREEENFIKRKIIICLCYVVYKKYLKIKEIVV
jgi:hypothetical protein